MDQKVAVDMDRKEVVDMDQMEVAGMARLVVVDNRQEADSDKVLVGKVVAALVDFVDILGGIAHTFQVAGLLWVLFENLGSHQEHHIAQALMDRTFERA